MRNGWSDMSFMSLLKMLKNVLLKGNKLPDHTYKCKKILCLVGMEYKKIHAHPNYCILLQGGPKVYISV